MSLSATGPQGAWAETFDIVIRGGEVLDGTGRDAYRADIGIRDERIAFIGPLDDARAEEIIDATGLTIVPGFIDLHSHADGPSAGAGLRSYNPRRRAAPNQIAQGVTTVVVNQDGRSPLNLARQRTQLNRRGMAPNVVIMIGHNSIRRAVMKDDYERPATESEVEAMAGLVRQGMKTGAFGMTAGLEYAPGIWSTTDELVALVKEITPFGGVYIVHERSSGADPMWYVPSRDASPQSTMLDSILETIDIARRTGATVVATHIKARGAPYWGASAGIIDAIQTARNEGVRIYADQYPYRSSGSDGTFTLLPHWLLKEYDGAGTDYVGALKAARAEPATNALLVTDIRHQIARRGGAENIVVLDHPDRSLIGKSLDDLAKAYGISADAAAVNLQFSGYPKLFGGARIRGYSMSEKDIESFLVRPWVATASDSGVVLPNDRPVHPRHYGTFPRKIRRYALDSDLLTVAQAIRSMTSLPAEILGIPDRGVIKEGRYADLTLLDLETLRDRSTYFTPHRYPEGVVHVLINGVPVVRDAILLWTLPGTVLEPVAPPVRREPRLIDTD